MASVQKHREHFANVPQINIQRSTFDRSQGVKTSFDAGFIVPLKVIEIIPGDTMQLNTAAFLRMLTPIVPFMDNVYFDLFAFFVPNRLVWNNWQKFMGEQTDPGDSTDFTIPQVSPINTQSGTLWDYFGLPRAEALEAIPVNALPSRGYNLIFNEWFRDEDLVDSLVVDKDNGPDDPTDYVTVKRMKRHDYFTSARPWPQKGPDVLIPTTGDAVVEPNGQLTVKGLTSNLTRGLYNTSASVVGINSGLTTNENISYAGGLSVDVSEIGGTINQLRQAEAIQVLLERDARGGTRYIEMLKSQYGVTNPDFRLQRPELIGQGQMTLSTTPVPQTSSTDETTPQGNLAAFSVATGGNVFQFSHSFTEHGYVHILISARADLNYQQGLEKTWSRKKRFDFYVPALANLGEQAILNKELYWRDPALAPTWNDTTFGFQERWAEYRYGYNNITGKFRPNALGTGNLSQWTLAQWFTTPPNLNKAFVEENPPMDRVVAIEPEADTFYGDFWFNIKHTRPMPVYSIPGWSKNL